MQAFPLLRRADSGFAAQVRLPRYIRFQSRPRQGILHACITTRPPVPLRPSSGSSPAAAGAHTRTTEPAWVIIAQVSSPALAPALVF
eukprot:scaffold72192_cov19-Tisochrysis_lutea.AAC.1